MFIILEKKTLVLTLSHNRYIYQHPIMRLLESGGCLKLLILSLKGVQLFEQIINSNGLLLYCTVKTKIHTNLIHEY